MRFSEKQDSLIPGRKKSNIQGIRSEQHGSEKADQESELLDLRQSSSCELEGDGIKGISDLQRVIKSVSMSQKNSDFVQSSAEKEAVTSKKSSEKQKSEKSNTISIDKIYVRIPVDDEKDQEKAELERVMTPEKNVNASFTQ